MISNDNWRKRRSAALGAIAAMVVGPTCARAQLNAPTPPDPAQTAAISPPAQPRVESSIEQSTRAVPCGPACLAIVCKLFNREVNNAELDALADENGLSSFEQLAEYLVRRGLHCAAVEATPTLLRDTPHIAILQMRAPRQPTEPERFHFTVCVGKAGAESVYVLDPVSSWGRGEVRLDSLANKWTGRALLVSASPISIQAINYRQSSPAHADGRFLSNGAASGAAVGGAAGVALCLGLAVAPAARHARKHPVSLS